MSKKMERSCTAFVAHRPREGESCVERHSGFICSFGESMHGEGGVDIKGKKGGEERV